MFEFTIPSMTCGHCVSVVTRALQHADTKARVDIDLTAKRVVIETEEDRKAMVDALTEAGYPPK